MGLGAGVGAGIGTRMGMANRNGMVNGDGGRGGTEMMMVMVMVRKYHLKSLNSMVERNGLPSASP